VPRRAGVVATIDVAAAVETAIHTPIAAVTGIVTIIIMRAIGEVDAVVADDVNPQAGVAIASEVAVTGGDEVAAVARKHAAAAVVVAVVSRSEVEGARRLPVPM